MYCYPKVTYDFKEKREVPHQNMLELEETIRDQLTSGQPDKVKDGLSSILYWGHRRAGYCMTRVNKFRGSITKSSLKRATEILPGLTRTDILTIKDLLLPEFSNMSFISKLRMFLDPATFVTLDRSLMRLEHLRLNFKVQKTSIPANKKNEKAYENWSQLCRKLAADLTSRDNVRAVDVERGFFYLIDQGQKNLAEEIYSIAEAGSPSP